MLTINKCADLLLFAFSDSCHERDGPAYCWPIWWGQWCHGARVVVHKMSLSRRVVRSSCCVYSTFCLLWLVQRNVLLALLKIVVSINITLTPSSQPSLLTLLNTTGFSTQLLHQPYSSESAAWRQTEAKEIFPQSRKLSYYHDSRR